MCYQVKKHREKWYSVLYNTGWDCLAKTAETWEAHVKARGCAAFGSLCFANLSLIKVSFPRNCIQDVYKPSWKLDWCLWCRWICSTPCISLQILDYSVYLHCSADTDCSFTHSSPVNSDLNILSTTGAHPSFSSPSLLYGDDRVGKAKTRCIDAIEASPQEPSSLQASSSTSKSSRHVGPSLHHLLLATQGI